MPQIPEPGPAGSENDEASDEEENRFSKIIKVHRNMGLVARKPVFGVSDKASFKPVSSATETC